MPAHINFFHTLRKFQMWVQPSLSLSMSHIAHSDSGVNARKSVSKFRIFFEMGLAYSVLDRCIAWFGSHYRVLFDFFLVWIWTSFITTTRGCCSFVVATAAGQFDLKNSWHFHLTSILSSLFLKYRYWSMIRMRSPFFDVINSTWRAFFPEKNTKENISLD